jgi:hypothetical protein
VQEFNFTVESRNEVTLRTLSFAGGINAEGTTIASGGFDTIVSLFNAATGDFIEDNDEGYQDLPIFPRLSHDSFLAITLYPGNYIATVTQFNSFPYEPVNGSLSNGFHGTVYNSFFGGDQHWALDILNVESASLGRTYVSAVDTIPEPETYVLLLAGLGLVGFIARRRKQIF